MFSEKITDIQLGRCSFSSSHVTHKSEDNCKDYISSNLEETFCILLAKKLKSNPKNSQAVNYSKCIPHSSL